MQRSYKKIIFVIVTIFFSVLSITQDADARLCFWCERLPMDCPKMESLPVPENPCMVLIVNRGSTVDVEINTGSKQITTPGFVDEEGILIGVNKDNSKGLVLNIVQLNNTITNRETTSDIFYGFSKDSSTFHVWGVTTKPNDSTDQQTLDSLYQVWNKPTVKNTEKERSESDAAVGIKKEGVKRTPSSEERPAVPIWIRNNAEWFSKGLISEDDYVSALEWLINNEIIRIAPVAMDKGLK